jgi:hypothetical protein
MTLVGLVCGSARACRRLARLLALLFPLAALSANSFAGQVKLAWDAVASATGYRVYYGTSSGNYPSSIDAKDNTTATVPGLTDGARYYFAVKAYNATTTSAFSNEVNAVVPPSSAASNPFGGDTTPPAAPQGLRISAN